MDPQSQSFTPYSSSSDTWRLQSEVTRLQQVQQDHSDRIARIERKQEEDARMKSVWGTNSPFPSGLTGGTPQQVPLSQPPADHFRNFDDDTNNLISSLHLDAEDEPRRGLNAASRAASVRFDETANQAHFSHSSRPSMEFMSRTSSGLGGLQMNERSSSHKSEGRASSVHSIRSAASGRANSLNLETNYGLGDSNRSPYEGPGLAPGLLLLGSVPAIIRCWMNMNFTHDALLYAAVCTGSYKSFLDLRLVQKLGYEAIVQTKSDGSRAVRLPVFFPEAVPISGTSRPHSPAPQLPTLTVDFDVIEVNMNFDKPIQVFLGSNVLRAHSADILFSSNSMTLFDHEQTKLSIPLVRPEDEASFKSLFITTTVPPPPAEQQIEEVKDQSFVNGVSQESSGVSVSSAAASPPPTGKYRPPGALAASSAGSDSAKAGAPGSDSDIRPASRQSTSSRPPLSLLNTRSEASESTADPSSQPGASRSGSSPAIWGNWRRDGNSATSAAQASSVLDYASASKSREPSYQRKETGMKVLKPKTSTRAVSSTAATLSSSPAAEGRSRFFDEGRRRSELEADAKPKESEGLPASAAAASTPKSKSNPIGGGSAFTWLSGGGGGSSGK